MFMLCYIYTKCALLLYLKKCWGISLVVQWLRLHAPNAGDPSSIPDQGIRSHMPKLGRKVMTNLDSILKSRDTTLPTKVYLVKAMVFPVVMYGCELDYKESWMQKNWCFWTVVLEKTLESPLDCKESILKEISPEYSLEGLILKLKLQYFGHLMWRTDSFEKTPMLGKIEVRRRRGQQRMR